MKRIICTLMILAFAFSVYAADGREILNKAFNYLGDQGVKKYSCTWRMDPPNPMLKQVAFTWEAPGKITYDIKYADTVPEQQKAMVAQGFKDQDMTPEGAVDNLLKTFKIDKVEDKGKAWVITFTATNPAMAGTTTTYVIDKEYKVLGTSTKGPNMSSKTVNHYTEISGIQVLDKIESTTKTSYEMMGKKVENETKTTTYMENYKITK